MYVIEDAIGGQHDAIAMTKQTSNEREQPIANLSGERGRALFRAEDVMDVDCGE